MDLVHVEKSVKKVQKNKPLENQVYNNLLKSKPPALTYEDYSQGRLAPAPAKTISSERLQGFLARQNRHELQR
jgi:hypothetical protein